ncbi:Antibiotic biosynthesis monooxygenase [Mycolicibacterium rutilum]|uniref:Antibiotic biosynthesis monooxygenase n=1 Tax=Mycolicibacterium rutilum TaxID=370526 RepID=A0A1H6J3T0_MYCRU|nr:putative quinol monooxygenase [Mycolicibacterium rutilum]SEH54125.1 Antibiotic biosynthesis monooxygenase [Mycolicibacterium rutilum]
MTGHADVVVVAHWWTTGAGLSDVLTFAAQARPASLAEPGCLGYEVLQDTTDANHLVLVEHYRDEVALEDHLNSPHYQELVVGSIRPLLTDRTVEFLRPREEVS